MSQSEMNLIPVYNLLRELDCIYKSFDSVTQKKIEEEFLEDSVCGFGDSSKTTPSSTPAWVQSVMKHYYRQCFKPKMNRRILERAKLFR